MYYTCIRRNYIEHKHKKSVKNENGSILHLYVHGHCSHTSFHNYVLLVKILPSRSSNVISVYDQTYQGSESLPISASFDAERR